VVGQHRLGSFRRIPGGFTTWRGTSRSTHGIGMAAILRVQWQTPRDPMIPARYNYGCSAAAIGTTKRASCGRRAADGMGRRTRAATKVSVPPSVSY